MCLSPLRISYLCLCRPKPFSSGSNFKFSFSKFLSFLRLSQLSQNTGCLKKTEFCQIKRLQILLVTGEKYLWFFVTNPVQPVKSGVVGLIPVWIILRNHLFLCNLLFFSAPFQTLYAPKAVSTKRPIKALKLPTQSMIQLDLPQISLSISPQILAGSANAQFGKTQFFWDTLYRARYCWRVAAELLTIICVRRVPSWMNKYWKKKNSFHIHIFQPYYLKFHQTE